MNNSEQLDDLITRSFGNELNGDEQAFLSQWLHASDKNRQYYDALKNTWQLMKAKQTPEEINVDKEWAYFKECVQQDDRAYTGGNGSKGIIRGILVATAIAASMLGVVAGFFWLATKKSNTVPVAVIHEKTSPIMVVAKQEVNNTRKARVIVLPDSSEVVLDPSSEIAWNEPFIHGRRDIVLKGRAHFKVAKDRSKPFTVTSGQIATTALGTQFTVTAFENDALITVQLFEGRVVVKPADSLHPKLNNNYYLLPGEELVYNNKQHIASVRRFINENTAGRSSNNNELTNADQPSLPAGDKGSWYMFNNQPLTQVFKQLETMYGVDIVFSEKEVEKMYFIGKFSKTDSVGNILKQICVLNNLTVTRHNNSYIISR